MKTKIKRHYRSVVSVLLSVCMLVSCMTVGLIATDAAKVTDSEAVGAKVDGDSSVGDSLSSMGVGFYLNTNKTSSGRSSDYCESSLTLNQESRFTVAEDGVYYLEFDIWGQDGNGGWHNLSAYASLAQNGDYVADSSSYAQTWSAGGSKKFKAGTTYAVCVKKISDKTQDTDYKAEAEFYLKIVPDDQTVTITSVSGTTATVTGTNASGAVTISESDTNKTLTTSSTANVSVAVTDNTQKVDYVQILDSSDAELSKAYLTYSGSENTYSGSFSVPNQTCKVKAHLADKSSYKVLAVPSNVADGTAEVTTAGYSATTAYLENTPLTLHAAGLDGKSFTGWDKGTDKGNADATYYVNSADVDTSGGDTITLTATFKTNKYNASATINNGSTQSLYTGVNATFFDYYYDTEYNSETWLNIGSTDPTVQEPFTKLNTALKEYAQTNNVQIPLYFGTLYGKEDGYRGSGNSMDYNFYFAANDSNGINAIGGADNNDGLTGLSGTRLDNGTITHINYTDLNDASTAGNGVPMAMFDEAWLTSRTSAAGITKPLATIINSPFPVVEQTVTRHNKLYLNVDSWWKDAGATFRAVFYNEAEDKDGVVAAVTATGTDYLYEVIVPGDYKYVKFYRQNPSNPSDDWGNSGQQTVPLSTDNKIQLNTGDTCSWNTSSMSTDKVSYKYYGFDSLNGKDNAFFTGISSTGPNSPVMNYYRDSKQINDRKGNHGFFPFDSNIAGTTSQANDFGYGMKMNIEFQLGDDGTLDNGAQQEFTFSGDDDLWVFVDGQLILDLGGAHGRTWGAINFATGTVTANQSVAMHKDSATAADSTHHAVSAVKAVTRNSTFTLEKKEKHTMTIFYMERGKLESNLKFGFSMTPVKNAFIAEKALSTDTINSDSSFKTQVEEIAKANDKFSFTNTWATAADSDADSDYAAPASGKKFMFTHDGSDTTMHTDGTGNLPPGGQYLTFGDTADFIGQFTAGDYFKLTERSSPANKFVYNQSLKVTDMITQTDISADSAHANGYLFQTTKASPTEADPVKIRGLWTNAIATKDITITKKASETTTEDFEICVLVKLPTKSSFEAYPLAISGGNSNKLDAEGKTTINQNQTITISGIPVNAQVKVSETEAHGFTPSITAVALDVNGAPVSGFSISDGEFTVPEDAEDSVAVTVSNTKATGKKVKIYKTLTSGTSEQTYTMFIKTVSTLDDASPADYSGTYKICSASDDSVVGTYTYDTSAGVSITTAQYILLENVSTSTKLEVTEKVLSSAYVRAFHYAYTMVGIGRPEQTQITATSDADPIAVDNGVRFSVTDNTVVNVYNKPWTYYIKYNYPAYLARYYGTTPLQQFYVKTGAFTDADFDATTGLLTIDSINDNTGNPRPCPVFKDMTHTYDEIKDDLSSFITTKAPYEDNFMSTLTWNPIFATSGSNVQNTYITYKPLIENANVEIETRADERPNKTVYAYFRLPYDHESWSKAGGKRLDPIATDGKVLKTAWKNYRVETQYGTWVTLNDATTKSEAQWVEAAPEIYGSDGKTYVFDYWQMTSIGNNESFVDVDGHTKPERLHELKLEIPYKRCYNLAFNMTMYQDSYVEAKYVEKGTERANMTQQQKEAADTNQVSNGAVINFLENSRNQWNNNGGTLYRESYENIASRIAKGDRIFSDFLLSFHMENDITLAGDLSKTVKEPAKDEQGNTVVDAEGNTVMVDVSYPILKGGSETVNYQIGVVIERVGELSKNGDNYVVETQDTYKTRYDAEEALVNQKNNVINYLNGTNPDSKYLKDEFSAKALDNKNEMEYSYSLPVNNSNNRQNYVYRAFAYLKDYTIDPNATYTFNSTNIAADKLGNHTGAILRVSDPVYFTIYDMASIKDGETYSGGGQS